MDEHQKKKDKVNNRCRPKVHRNIRAPAQHSATSDKRLEDIKIDVLIVLLASNDFIHSLTIVQRFT